LRKTLPFLMLAALGCAQSNSDSPVLVVTTSYPGASAQVVADSVAAPIEQQINGTERLDRIESESRNDGTYVAFLHFKSNSDATMAMALVQNRLALAEPTLPDIVKRAGVIVKVKPPAKADERVRIALIDEAAHGRETMRKLTDAVVKRIADDAALTKVETFPDRTAVFRVDLHPAIRLTGAPANRKSVASSATQCAEIAVAERERLQLGRVVVLDISEK
jgi:multidrug efflux pump subunit AcrB